MKTSYRINDLHFFVGPGETPGTIIERITAELPGPFAYVTEQHAMDLIREHGEELQSQGCKHLLGTDWAGVWWFDFENQKFVDTDVALDDDMRSFGHIMSDEPTEAEWFVIRLLDEPFQRLTYEVAGESFDFALIRGNPQ